MTEVSDPAEVYSALRAAINVSGTTRPGHAAAPGGDGGDEQRGERGVDVHELNGRAGDIIADIVGAEAAFVSSGSAGGLVLQAAAVMAGNDPAKMAQLPDTTGLRTRSSSRTASGSRTTKVP